MFLRTTSSRPRSYHDGVEVDDTPMPAMRARSTASRTVWTKLTSVRSGLVGSTASRTSSSLARATSGAMSLQNVSAASSHGIGRRPPGRRRTARRCPRAAVNSSDCASRPVARHARHQRGRHRGTASPARVPSGDVELRRDQPDVVDTEVGPECEVLVERLVHRADGCSPRRGDGRTSSGRSVRLARRRSRERTGPPWSPSFAAIIHSWWLIRQPSGVRTSGWAGCRGSRRTSRRAGRRRSASPAPCTTTSAVSPLTTGAMLATWW